MDWQLPSKATELLWTLAKLPLIPRPPLLWRMTIQPVVGVYCLYPVNDNISKMRSKRCKIQITQTLILLIWWHQLYLGCVFSLARVRLSKHYTTKTATIYSKINEIPSLRVLWKIDSCQISSLVTFKYSRRTKKKKRYIFQYLTSGIFSYLQCALRMLGKIIFVAVYSAVSNPCFIGLWCYVLFW